jgi:hypothetical protein
MNRAKNFDKVNIGFYTGNSTIDIITISLYNVVVEHRERK